MRAIALALFDDELDRGELARWLLAGLIVLAAHLGVLGAYMYLHKPDSAGTPSTPAVLIELAPLSTSPDLPQSDAPPAPEMVQSQSEPQPPDPTVKPEEPVVEPPPPVQQEALPEPTPEPPAPVQQEALAEPTPEPPLAVEPVVPVPSPVQKPEVPVIAAPPPRPAKPVEKKPEAKRAEPKRQANERKKAAPMTTAPTAAPTPRRAQVAAAPAAGAESASAIAAWRNQLVAHLQRHKRYPSDAESRRQEGVVSLAFTMDRNGRVLARSISRSSGVPSLDAEVMAMIQRAQPLPRFPPAMTQSQMSLSVPIRFSLR